MNNVRMMDKLHDVNLSLESFSLTPVDFFLLNNLFFFLSSPKNPYIHVFAPNENTTHTERERRARDTHTQRERERETHSEREEKREFFYACFALTNFLFFTLTAYFTPVLTDVASRTREK